MARQPTRANAVKVIVMLAACATAINGAGDGLRAQPREAGRVIGRVLDDARQNPIAGARVTIAGGSGAMAGFDPQETDERGRFGWTGLPAGRYRVAAERSGYLRATAVVAMPSRAPIDLRLKRGAVMSGFVTDEFGDPIPNLAVHVDAAGARAATSVTDDLGYFRIWGLEAATYTLWARLETRTRLAGATDVLPVTTYFPGVPSRSQAETIAVATGQELEGLNFVAKFGRHVTAAITVLNSTGAPARDAELWMVDANEPRRQNIVVIRSDAPGRFLAAKLAPGDYRIGAVASGPGSSLEYSTLHATVSGDEDEASLLIATAPVARMSGRIRMAAETLSIANTRLVVSTVAAAGADEIPGSWSARFSAATDPQGRFTVSVPPGPRVIQVRGLAPGWAPVSMRAAGKDVIDRAVRFDAASPIDDSDIVISDRFATVTGLVRGVAPDARALAVLFTTDRSRWTRGSRSILGVAADLDGRFAIMGVRPGEYVAAAVDARHAGSLHDPVFLTSLMSSPAAAPVSVGSDAAPLALIFDGR